MEFKFTYLPLFAHSLEKLPSKHQKQVLKKIKMIQGIKDLSIFQYIKPLVKEIEHTTHKLKAGEYRVYFRVSGNVFEIQNVIIRGEAYRK